MRHINGRLYTPEDDAAIVRMRAEGVKWEDISTALGRSVGSIERHALAAKLPIAKKFYAGRDTSSISRRTVVKNEVFTDRKCLCCTRVFQSWGIGNRMCDYCRRFERVP